jgi:hypothetical protein
MPPQSSRISGRRCGKPWRTAAICS